MTLAKYFLSGIFFALVLVVLTLCFFYSFLGLKQDDEESAIRLNPARWIAHNRQLVQEHPADAGAHQQLGNSYSFGHREAEAVKEYQKALQLSHSEVSPGLYFSLANALLATGERTQAREALKQEVASDAPLCQAPPASERYAAEVECGAWVEAKEMLRKFPAKQQRPSPFAAAFQALPAAAWHLR